MRVLALTTYPVESAATRFRLHQLVRPLHEQGVELDIRPLLSSSDFHGLYDRASAGRTAARLGRAHLRRLGDVLDSRRADIVLLQREAALLGPPVIELLIGNLSRKPMVLDLDDPTWVAYDSPTFGRAGRLLKWPGKTDWLIDRAAVVTCGSRAIADHVERRGATARLVPTVVNTDVFRPRAGASRGAVPLVGWIGTHSTLPYLTNIGPALSRAAAEQRFRLLVVGGGAEVSVQDVEVEARPWSMAQEVADFRSLDIGLYPLADDEWARGKSGFKAIQYLACGVPFVVSPVGATCDIGIAGATHLEATSLDEWTEAVHRLLSDSPLRTAMGAAARAHALERYTIPKVSRELVVALRMAA